MIRGRRLPNDQAEVVFVDLLIEQLESFPEGEQVDILAGIVRLCEDPSGKHPLHAPLAGWNTVDVLATEYRVVYKATEHDGVGLIEVLCVGRRRGDEVYDMATAISNSGRLSPDEITQFWEALGLLDVVVASLNLDEWDYKPPPAPAGLQRAAVAAGLLDAETASLLGKDEIEAAMEAGWGPSGPDPAKALSAAVARARGSANFSDRKLLEVRSSNRCGAIMPRAMTACIRADGHRGPHRAT